jgi:hypothetical protein
MTFSTGLHPVLTNMSLSGQLVILLGVVEGRKRWSAQRSGKPDRSKMKTSIINYRLNKGRTMRDVFIVSEGRPERATLVSTGHSPVLMREPNPKP